MCFTETTNVQAWHEPGSAGHHITVHDIHDEWIVNVFTTTVISERQILYHCVEFRAVWVVVLKVFDSFLNSCNASKILVQSARRSETEKEN